MRQAITAFVTVLATTASSSAMDIRVETLGDGFRFVSALGPIVAGDADRLRDALATATVDRDGFKQVALNSPGGDVSSALEMANVMDATGVSTYVMPGSICGSACATILFVAGTYRMLVGDGKLAIHTCYDATGTPLDWCNDEIALFAVRHGVAYGSVYAFMSQAGPGDAFWFTRADAECFGMLRAPGDPPSSQMLAPCVVAAIKSTPR